MFRLGQAVRVKAEVKTEYLDMPYLTWEIISRPPETEKEDPGQNRIPKVLLRHKLDPPQFGVIIGRSIRYTGWRRWIGPEEGYAFIRYRGHRVYLIARHLRWSTPMLALEEDIEEQKGDVKDVQS